VAAVGVQCVDCVKDGARTVRSARTVFGATLRSDQRPIVTFTVLGLCIVAWVAQITGVGDLTDRFMFMPAIARDEPWRFLTAAFLHSPDSPLHIGFNMYALWLVGPPLEAAFGRARFVGVYLLAALGGSVAMLVAALPAGCNSFGDAWYRGSLGASGAVFGMFGAMLVANRRVGADNAALIGVLAINAILGFTIDDIAWEAHLGGFVVGVIAAVIISAGARGRAGLSPAVVQGTGLALLGLVLLVVVLVIFADLGMLTSSYRGGCLL
jgi:membrane associated rhomboid family serine protease